MKKTEMEKSMEQMLKLLHDEWSRTGRSKAEVFISKKDAEKLSLVITEATLVLQSCVDAEDVTFKESLQYSKEAFIHFRIAKKVNKACEKAAVENVVITLDKEELARFKELALAGGVAYWERSIK
ncbi:MAG: hypothetical protein NC412_05860 [Roseburia sp.]|nr:hypothetical protein [Roseburia sp.]